MTPAIRDATDADRAAVEALWSDCLRLHGAVPAPEAFARLWAWLGEPGRGYGLRLAEHDGAVRGMALHLVLPNSWTGRFEVSLDTLHVEASARGRGLGGALLRDLMALARARGWSSAVWHVAPDNAAARALYDRVGRPDGYLRYRVGL